MWNMWCNTYTLYQGAEKTADKPGPPRIIDITLLNDTPLKQAQFDIFIPMFCVYNEQWTFHCRCIVIEVFLSNVE